MSRKDNAPSDGPVAALTGLCSPEAWRQNFDRQMVGMRHPYIDRHDWADGVEAALVSMDMRLKALEAARVPSVKP